MEDKESLSDFIEEDMYIGPPELKEETDKSGEMFMISVPKIKEKIQNAQRRLKEEFLDDWANANGKTFTLNEIREKINKIFLEEFGRKLIK